MVILSIQQVTKRCFTVVSIAIVFAATNAFAQTGALG